MTDRVDQRQAAFDALADPTRRALLERIGTEGPISLGRLAAGFPVSRQAITRHLELLEAGGLITSDKKGRARIFALQPQPIDAAAEWLQQVGEQWDRRLLALQRMLEAESDPHPAGTEHP